MLTPPKMALVLLCCVTILCSGCGWINRQVEFTPAALPPESIPIPDWPVWNPAEYPRDCGGQVCAKHFRAWVETEVKPLFLNMQDTLRRLRNDHAQ